MQNNEVIDKIKLDGIPLPDEQNGKAPAIKHFFNDTKHRWVKYKLIASTRYKEYFYHLINKYKEQVDKDEKPAFSITRESNLVKK